MSPSESFVFLPQPEKKEQLSSRGFKRLPIVSTTTTSRYTTLISGMLMLLMLIGSVLGSQPEISSDLFLNRLNMSFVINYKYIGLLHHSIDRLWIVTKVALPKLEDIHFPDIAFDPDCAFVKSLKHSGTATPQIGDRSFSIAAPTLWNKLPIKLRLRQMDHLTFKRELKTHLFAETFN